METDIAIDRWISLAVATLLFVVITWLAIGQFFRRALSGKVVIATLALIALGILPLPFVQSLIVGTFVFLFTTVHLAYTVAMSLVFPG